MRRFAGGSISPDRHGMSMGPAPSHGRMLRLLFWESTIRCNLACVHCRRLESNDAAPADLTTAQAKDLIEQVAGLGRTQPTMPVLVFSGGEPLCRDDLFELIRFADRHRITPALATNGTLIDAAIAKQIADSRVARVSVSLDGADGPTHDGIRKVSGSFGRTLQGIRFLHEQGVPFQINMTVTQRNRHQLEDLYNLALSLGAVAVHPFMLVPVGCGAQLAETDMMTAGQYEQALREIAELEKRGDLQIKVTCGPHYERVKRQRGLSGGLSSPEGSPGGPRHGAASRGCLVGLGVLFVGHQGDVLPCGYLPVLCGSILREPLEHLWHHSEDLIRLGDGDLLEGKCGLCGFRRVCGGCRARAYAQTRNYLAEEPFCIYEPKETHDPQGEEGNPTYDQHQ
jgi:radical SAM protein with 4Fe4S-binding SPASM domain